MVKKLNKKRRQFELLKLIDTNPFVTDEELAKHFAVSVQTIRLDRLELDIPELRTRTMQVAEKVHQKVKSMVAHEMVGELIELQLGKFATSVLKVGREMVAEKSQVCRGDYLFAQANTLAAALIDAEIVLTGSARLRFRRPVYLHEKVIAHAFLARKKINKYLIKVVSEVGTEEVFVGKFIFAAKQEVDK
jgi:acyl-coenzyme A thioesterase PaaI-like protein